MTLTGARVARSATVAVHADLEIHRGRIARLTAPQQSRGQQERTIDLRGHLILPGLINSHVHLEFNLFPRLGHGPYPNATAWAEDIYDPDRSQIK